MKTRNGETRQQTRIDIFKVFWFLILKVMSPIAEILDTVFRKKLDFNNEVLLDYKSNVKTNIYDPVES